VTALRFLSKKQVRELTTLSFSQQDRLRKAGNFPKLYKLGRYRNSRVVMLEEDVLEWMRDWVAEPETD
jgi:predicted DNA-binding transcriptional regulator AlpA